jgi:signal transduction histidine kinase/ActR/RegA family two-component response regulator
VLFANVANSLVVTATLWGSSPHAHLLGWSGLMLLLTLVRVELRRRYWRANPDDDAAWRWGARFVISSMLAGATWGAAGVLFFGVDAILSRLLLTFSIGGMVAGAAGSLACYPPAFWAFSVPALVPLIVRTLAYGDGLHLALATMMTVYAVAISGIARTAYRSVTEAFRLRFENEALLAQLTVAQRELEETNRSLEERVAERTAQVERQAEMLRDAQRMESVGRLAGGIAHDFNNLLTVVQANADVLVQQQRLDPDDRESVIDMRNAAQRGAALVSQLLAFSRRQRRKPRVVDLNQIVRDSERLLAPLIGKIVHLHVELMPGRALVKVDPSQLEQVIVNLSTNARDAMPNGGRLHLATAIVDVADDPLLGTGQYVRLSVSDTGVGMSSETQRHAFDPFFTTKDVGRGTGLGLATVHGVVEQSGGRISVDTRPGAGSRFDVHLPCAPDTDVADDPVRDTEPMHLPRSATILVAEDESDVRSVARRMLRLSGYEILTAADGKEALELARAHSGSIDLLLTDVMMNPMSGLDLARKLRKERPHVRVLFMTGYTFERELPDASPAQGVDYLEKPFTLDDLNRKVGALLALPERRPEN